MDEQPERNRTAYGKFAEQFKDEIIAEHVRKLTKPKEPGEEAPDRTPQILKDPQGLIIRGRMLRFKPTITSYAKNFCLRLISRDDFLIATRNDTRKLLQGVGAMGSIMLSSSKIEKAVQEIVDMLYRMTEGIPLRDMDINMVPPLVDTVMKIVENTLAERTAKPAHEKFQELRKQQGPTLINDPLDEFPPKIRELLLNRLPTMGLNPRDMPTLKRLARQMGLDPDEAIEELKQGRIPEKLKNFL